MQDLIYLRKLHLVLFESHLLCLKYDDFSIKWSCIQWQFMGIQNMFIDTAYTFITFFHRLLLYNVYITKVSYK